MATAVFFHAHPDDEAIQTGRTMARMAAEGHRVVLVTATRGELGEVAEGFLSPGETLTERHALELAAACDALGVARHEYLGYRDSGMAGEPSNGDSDCFWQADVDEAATRLASILDEEHADILGHLRRERRLRPPRPRPGSIAWDSAPEHAKTERVFMATMNRDHLLSLADRADEFGIAMPDEQRSMLDTLGVRAERITTAVDVTAYLDRKRRAMEMHASQISDTSFFLMMSPEVFTAVWGTEWYIRVSPEGEVGMQDSLLAPAGT